MPARARENEHMRGKHMWFWGILLFIVGLILNMGYGWDVVFMVIGAIVFLKGLFVKFMKK